MPRATSHIVNLCAGDFPSPNSGGVEAYINDLSGGLSSLGLNITVIAHGKSNEEKTLESFKLINLNTQRLKFSLGKPTLTQMFNDAFFAAKACSRLPSSASIIQVYSLFCALNASKKMPRDCKLVYTSHDPSWLSFPPSVYTQTNWFLQSSILKKANAVTAFNQSMKESMIRNGGLNPGRVFVVPPCRDTNHFFVMQPNDETLEKYALHDKLVILFVGVVVPRKGVHVLVQAFERFIRRNGGKNVKLLIVGSFAPWGSEKPSQYAVNLMNYCNKNRLSEHICFTGRVSPEDLRQLYCASSVFVLPSFLDAMPGVIIEAMACGKPVIGSRISGISDLIVDGECGYTFKAGDADALFEIFENILDCDHLLNRLGKNARKMAVERYSRRAVAMQMKSIYELIS
jgi:glycosyltransferase involved in cell wall biosynthesis